VVAARAAWTAGNVAQAVQHVEHFADTVRAHSGSAIPDVWRATGDLENVAGLLRSAANTLRFSLNLGG
jgi:hypothetical protein